MGEGLPNGNGRVGNRLDGSNGESKWQHEQYSPSKQ